MNRRERQLAMLRAAARCRSCRALHSPLPPDGLCSPECRAIEKAREARRTASEPHQRG